MLSTRTAALLLWITGCATEPREDAPCERAAEALERCGGTVPDGFAEVCAADPDRVASGVLAETDPESCETSAKGDGLQEPAFVGACAGLLQAAAWVVWAKSPPAQPLSAELRAQLRPWYGDLVDRARISWRSGLLTRWRVMGREVVFDAATLAQTFDDRIYIREAPRAHDLSQAATIGHELAHVAQYRALGGVAGFARAYCEAYYDAGFSYRDNALEVEAYDTEDRIEGCLAHGTDCP